MLGFGVGLTELCPVPFPSGSWDVVIGRPASQVRRLLLLRCFPVWEFSLFRRGRCHQHWPVVWKPDPEGRDWLGAEEGADRRAVSAVASVAGPAPSQTVSPARWDEGTSVPGRPLLLRVLPACGAARSVDCVLSKEARRASTRSLQESRSHSRAATCLRHRASLGKTGNPEASQADLRPPPFPAPRTLRCWTCAGSGRCCPHT